MSTEDERRARDLFLELCELGEPERARRLEAATEGDAALRRAVQGLLAEDTARASFLDEPVLGEGFRISGPYAATGRLAGGEAVEAEWHPEAIGPYRILGVLGRGGMGVVYRAEQQRPRRTVALKVLHAGVPRGLDVEAEALGRLKHPGIAQIYEEGTADFGRGPVPFLVMELVDGVDLGRHARDEQLSTGRRVELLARVCRAVHHAHQKGVVHRDLKPRNVLVSAGGEPKVLDFGLARLTDAERSRSVGSGAGDIVGTLAYMSPEQIAGDTDEIDASTDVYSLGITAYELLAGKLPFELADLPLPALVQRVMHEEPVPLRQSTPAIDRDLAAVVERAIAREKEARYSSAAALADDLVRWSRDEPVLARPASGVEQVRRFARRNRALVGGVLAVVLALIAGFATTTWQARTARREVARNERIRTFLQGTLYAAGDARKDGRELGSVYLLDRAARDLEVAFADDPYTRAALADTLGMAYFQNGVYDEALDLVGRALDWRTAELGARDAETLASRHNLGVVQIAHAELPEAERNLRAAYEGRREVLGLDAEDTQVSANWLGQVLLQKADPGEAEALLAESWAVRERTLGADALPTLATRERLALTWKRQGRVADAELTLREVLDTLRRICGPEDFELYETLNNLATLLLDLGQYGESRELLEEALEGYTRLRGPDHADTRLIAGNFDVVRGQLAAEVVDPREPELTSGGPLKSPQYYALLASMAGQKFYRGQIDEAEADLRSAIDGLARLGGQDRYVGPARQSLASVLVERGRLDEAIALQRSALELHRAAGTERSQYARIAEVSLAESLRRNGLLQPALEQIRETYAALVETAGEAAIYTLSARSTVAAVLTDLGQLDEALEHAEATVRVSADTLGADNAFTAMFRTRLGRVLVALGRYDDAERELLAAHAVLLERHTERGPYTRRAGEALAELYEAWGRPPEAMRWRALSAGTGSQPIEASAPRRVEDDR